MDKDILRKVVEVEKEIQDRLESEKEKSTQRIHELRTAAENELIELELSLQSSFEKSFEKARTNSQEKASDLLKKSESMSRQFEKTDDETLRKIILSHINSILPGA